MPGASNSVSEDRKDLLQEEYLRLCSDIRSIETGNEKLLGIGFSLMSFAAVVGVAKNVTPLFYLLPIAAIGTFTYAVTTYNALYSMAGYKLHIEELLNALIDERVLLWERLAETRERASITSSLLWVVYGLVGITVCVVSITSIIEHGPPLFGAGLGVVTALLTFFLLRGIGQMLGAKAAAYEQAKKLHAREM
jgi:hypothetical protein